MRSEHIRAAASAALILGAAGCTSPGDLKLGQADNWGEANRQTFAAQIINPAPEYDTAVPASSGEHAAQAVERYRTDKVKRPASQSLSTVGNKSGGGAAAATGGN